MAKSAEARLDKTHIVKTPGSNANFLAKYTAEDQSLKSMADYMIVPRLKIIQAMTDGKLKDQFGEGSAIMRPGDALIVKKNEKFIFNPHFFYTEFCLWSDRRDKDNPAIRGRTFDPTAEIAKRAMDKARRYEVYSGQENVAPDKQMKMRYIQHFVWLGQVYGKHAMSGIPVALSMEKGEYGQGLNFISAIQLRRITLMNEETNEEEKRPQPLWSQLWELTPGFRDFPDKKWWGFDFTTNMEVGPTISEEHVEACFNANAHLAKKHEARKIVVDHGEDDQGGDSAEPNKDKPGGAPSAKF